MLELLKGSNCSMLKLLELLKCSNCSMLKAPPQKKKLLKKPCAL